MLVCLVMMIVYLKGYTILFRIAKVKTLIDILEKNDNNFILNDNVQLQIFFRIKVFY